MISEGKRVNNKINVSKALVKKYGQFRAKFDYLLIKNPFNRPLDQNPFDLRQNTTKLGIGQCTKKLNVHVKLNVNKLYFLVFKRVYLINKQ